MMAHHCVKVDVNQRGRESTPPDVCPMGLHESKFKDGLRQTIMSMAPWWFSNQFNVDVLDRRQRFNRIGNRQPGNLTPRQGSRAAVRDHLEG